MDWIKWTHGVNAWLSNNINIMMCVCTASEALMCKNAIHTTLKFNRPGFNYHERAKKKTISVFTFLGGCSSFTIYLHFSAYHFLGNVAKLHPYFNAFHLVGQLVSMKWYLCFWSYDFSETETENDIHTKCKVN